MYSTNSREYQSVPDKVALGFDNKYSLVHTHWDDQEDRQEAVEVGGHELLSRLSLPLNLCGSHIEPSQSRDQQEGQKGLNSPMCWGTSLMELMAALKKASPDQRGQWIMVGNKPAALCVVAGLRQANTSCLWLNQYGGPWVSTHPPTL